MYNQLQINGDDIQMQKICRQEKEKVCDADGGGMEGKNIWQLP